MVRLKPDQPDCLLYGYGRPINIYYSLHYIVFDNNPLACFLTVADPRVDPEALELAFEFENACNIVLRQAARSFLSILTQEKLLAPLQ